MRSHTHSFAFHQSALHNTHSKKNNVRDCVCVCVKSNIILVECALSLLGLQCDASFRALKVAYHLHTHTTLLAHLKPKM